MEAGDRAAGDGDEAERKNLAREHGPVPSMKRVSAGICSVGRSAMIPSASMRDGAQLHERAEVVARRQQQPDRQRAGGESVNDDQNRQRRRLRT